MYVHVRIYTCIYTCTIHVHIYIHVRMYMYIYINVACNSLSGLDNSEFGNRISLEKP